MKPLDIFRAGTHTASDGRTLTFTDADIAATVAAYNPATHQAPLVVGHPKTDDPAYGWVASLSADSAKPSSLVAHPADVEPAFAELVAAKRFPNRSASFYPPDHSANPVPGVWYLKHVGFLGAAAPAVKGLRPAAFAEEAGVITFTEPEKSMADTATLVDPREAEFAEKSALIASRETELKAREAALVEAEAKIKFAANAARAREVSEFVEGVVKAGRVLPRHAEPMKHLLLGMTDAEIEFAEDGKVKKVAQTGWLREFLQALPVQVDFKERSAHDGDSNVVKFNAPAGFSIDANSIDLHNKALAYAEQHKVDYVAAVEAVRNAA